MPHEDERTPLLAESSAEGSRDSALRNLRVNGVGARPDSKRTTSNRSPHIHQQASSVDAKDIDVRFKRWVDHVKGKLRSKEQQQLTPLEKEAQFIVSVFGPLPDDPPPKAAQRSTHPHDGFLGDGGFAQQMTNVRTSIASGLLPKMIQTGSSGSYFVRMLTPSESVDPDASDPDGQASTSASLLDHEVVAVFKPNDEEPYGDLNPKRVLLRRYLWWAMGRPCLIPSFSYLSEVAASRLDTRLQLGIVPSTRLVSLASESFYYLPSERKTGKLREKPGSYQQFLRGYINVSAFLRAHPWPSRPRELLERDIRAENSAHGRAKARARKGRAEKPTKTRQCIGIFSDISCFKRRTRREATRDVNADDVAAQNAGSASDTSAFAWTSDLMDDFRHELEKLVCFDYLIRNTDRGLDNFMVRIVEADESGLGRRSLKLAAIDNSLAFPWTHPAGIRSYPWGWLYLPTDLIGGPFSDDTRAAFISHLSNPAWWHQSKIELERLFRQDEHFDVKRFEGQMEVLRGQGWNLLESLRSEDEGPLELCARQKQRVTQEGKIVPEGDIHTLGGTVCPLTTIAKSLQLPQADDDIAPPAQPEAKKPTAIAIREEASSRGPPPSSFKPMSLPGPRPPTKPIEPVRRDSDTRDTPVELEDPHENPADGAIGKAYRSGSLGIDVLKGMDKLNSRRPNLRKATTGRPAARRLGTVQGTSTRHVDAEVASDGEDMTSSLHEEQNPHLASSVSSLRPSQRKRGGLRSYQHVRQGSHANPWSIDGVLAGASASPEGTAQGNRRIRVILEHLIADHGVAWQTWLGL